MRTTLTGFSKPISSMIKDKSGNLLASGSQDGSIIVWQIGDDEVVFSSKIHKDQIDCLVFAGE